MIYVPKTEPVEASPLVGIWPIHWSVRPTEMISLTAVAVLGVAGRFTVGDVRCPRYGCRKGGVGG